MKGRTRSSFARALRHVAAGEEGEVRAGLEHLARAVGARFRAQRLGESPLVRRRREVLEAIAAANGDFDQAAKVLGVSRRTIDRRMTRCGLLEPSAKDDGGGEHAESESRATASGAE